MSRFIRSKTPLPIPIVPMLSALAIMLLAMGLAQTAAAQRSEITPDTMNFDWVGGNSILVTATTFDADDNTILPTSWTWTSSNESVATVSGSSTRAEVTPVGRGTATITFTAETPTTGNSPATTVTATSTVTVTPNVPDDARLEVSPAQLNFSALGEMETVSIRVYDGEGNVIEDAPTRVSGYFDLAWDVNGNLLGAAADIRSVPDGLEVTSLNDGSGRITIRIGNGQVTTVPVYVKNVPTTLTVTPVNLNLDIGDTQTLQATLTDANGNEFQLADGNRGGMVVNWETSDSAVATVEGTG